MEQELISKKELLELYGISYGALYRWKRKGLIPEDWFIKKSTVTGQETFFPRALICERMELILRQKDDVSLEEMAKQFSEESQKRATLVIETVLGPITVELADIKSAVIDGGDGSRTDVTSYIIGGKKS
jgi:DNA-binding transcriptional MerR regulator